MTFTMDDADMHCFKKKYRHDKKACVLLPVSQK